MITQLHKQLIINDAENECDNVSFKVHGTLIGWTDGDRIVNCDHILDEVKNCWTEGGPEFLARLMRGIVGSCIIEVNFNNEFWFFSSCASGGFYWTVIENNESYFVSNNEGKFLRLALQKGLSISNGALMNAILSHQSVIRPIFDGLVNKTKRCPPGFYVNFSSLGTKINSFLINDKPKTREQQDNSLEKKIDALKKLYDYYCVVNKTNSILSFSGGIDSTALLLAFKKILNSKYQGYYKYKNKGKISELKMAEEIANQAKCKINFIFPDQNISIPLIKKRARTGLSIFNGIGYLKNGFQTKPKNLNTDILILNGQNSDTMFHVDTFSASSFMKGVARKIVMAKGLYARFQSSIPYYSIERLIKKKNSRSVISRVLHSFISLSEHGENNHNFSINILNKVRKYKKKYYFSPYTNWLKNEYYPKLKLSKLTDVEKDNQAYRFARWLRTIGNFHQQFTNISANEKIIICTPYSEGPIAFELLSYKLSIIDVFYPKKFLHKYIKKKLGLSYGKVRNKILDDKLYNYPLQLIYYFYKTLVYIIKKLFYKIQNKNYVLKSSRPKIRKNDLNTLREILGHNSGIVDRFLIKFIDDVECKDYIDYLYDCIELKVDPNSISDQTGREICRLINLQIMLKSN